MSLGTHKLEGGHKRGHSNMTHWERTEELKRRTKKLQRLSAKHVIRESLLSC